MKEEATIFMHLLKYFSLLADLNVVQDGRGQSGTGKLEHVLKRVSATPFDTFIQGD